MSLASKKSPPSSDISADACTFEALPEVVAFQRRREAAWKEARERAPFDISGIPHPYFREREGTAGSTILLGGQRVLNFANYNYLGLAGHPEVNAAAQEAIERYGTSVSASRLIAGEIPLHGQLERRLAEFLGTEDALVLVSGHATNVSTIPHLVGREDLILFDSLLHDSGLRGATCSDAHRRPFRHNDLGALDRMLHRRRPLFRRALILVEGLYSMDGDLPDLCGLLELQERHRSLLMVDEAHSIGVLGRTGRGLAEHFGPSRRGNVLWMGTLSKSLASCGGFLAGKRVLIDYLRHSLSSFVYSVGMPPATAAAALKALEILDREPERVQRLRRNARFLRRELEHRGLSPLGAPDSPIVPLVVGEDLHCWAAYQVLAMMGVSVSPIVFPAVAQGAARLRLFVSSLHEEEQLRHAAGLLQECLATTARLGGG